MPRGTGYSRRPKRKNGGRRPRRLVTNPTRAMVSVPRSRSGGMVFSGMGAGARTLHPSMVNLAGEIAARTIQNFMVKTKGKRQIKALKETTTRTRGWYNKHEKLKSNESTGPINKGKGGRGMTTAKGTIYTHPSAKVPKWKLQRLKEYKNDVWQTVLLSKSSRIANSNNVLGTFRYPIKAPECLDSERVQAMVFTPYASAYSGIHTTFYRKIRADGTDLDHGDQPLDVIQNKADIQRHSLPGSVEAAGGSVIKYETDVVTAQATQVSTELNNVNAFYDQLFKGIHLDLVFMASRPFPVRVSVSVIRHIQPTAPHTWTTEDKQQLFNNLDNKGLEWSNYKVEYCHQFTLPGLVKDKKPSTYTLNKKIKMNVMITNSFNDNNTAEDMAQSSLNQLGLGLYRRSTEVADGLTSGNTYVLIKYRKIQQPQQFTYIQAIEADASPAGPSGIISAQVETVGLSEESFDIPVSDGLTSAGTGFEDGTPFSTNQGNEARASFYLHGKVKYQWGFKEDVESVPSIMSAVTSSTNYKKNQSLNIDPTITNDTNNGIYTQSQSHQTLAQSTANSGP